MAKMAIWGTFLALKVPGGREPDLFKGNVTCFITRVYVSNFWTNFRKIEWTDVKLLSEKCLFRHFRPFLGLFNLPWTRRALTRFFKNRRMSLFHLSKVKTSCQILDNLRRQGGSRVKKVTWSYTKVLFDTVLTPQTASQNNRRFSRYGSLKLAYSLLL